jgi:hypothetical protein
MSSHTRAPRSESRVPDALLEPSRRNLLTPTTSKRSFTTSRGPPPAPSQRLVGRCRDPRGRYSGPPAALLARTGPRDGGTRHEPHGTLDAARFGHVRACVLATYIITYSVPSLVPSAYMESASTRPEAILVAPVVVVVVVVVVVLTD